MQAHRDKMFILPFCLDSTSVINNHEVNGSGFYHGGKDYKLTVTPDITLNGNFQVTVYYLTYAFVRLINGKFSYIGID